MATSANLAVFTTELGATFIDKHAFGLRPGNTVVVASHDRHALGGGRENPLPVFRIDQWSLGFRVRIAQRLGARHDSLRDEAISRFLKRHNIGVVLGEYLDSFIDYVPLMERLGMPYVAQAHGMDVSKELRKPGAVERYLAYASAKAILTRCEFHRQRLIAIGLPAAKIHVNPGGVDVPDVPTVRPATAGKRIVAVGMMVPKKAPIMLLESFRRAVARDPELTLDYIGGGALFPAAQHFVRACGLSGHVRLHGYAPESLKQQLYCECGVFAQHSITSADGDEEGLPAAIQEAMGHGLAVVSTRHSGIVEAVVDGETGLLVDEGDVEAMGAAFAAIPARASEMGLAGHRRAAERFRWEHEKARLLQWL